MKEFDKLLEEKYGENFSDVKACDKKELLRELLQYKYEDFVLSFNDKSGKHEFYDDEGIVSYLLDEEVLFCNSRKYLCIDGTTKRPETIVLFMNCNDVFAWACADAEEVTLKELPGLCKMYIEDKQWGTLKWVCKKRNMQPQKPIRDDMKKDDAWCELMKLLELNPDEKKKKEEDK